MKKVNWLVVAAGLVVGAAAVLLTALGNPGNMGFCIACFLRDTSGALGLHPQAWSSTSAPRSSALYWAPSSLLLALRNSKAAAVPPLPCALYWVCSL